MTEHLKHQIIRFVILGVVTALITACSQSDEASNRKDTVKVGVLTGLTGANASYGRSTREGVELAVEEINASSILPGGFEAVFEDDQMTPSVGVSAFQRLQTSIKPAVVIGPFGSSVVLAIAPIANRTETVIISASATADSIADAGDFVFRITPANSRQGADIAEFSYNKLDARTAAVVFQRNDYGQTLRDAFISKFEGTGGKVVAVEGITGGSTDMRAMLTRIRGINPDVLFFPLHSQESTLLLRQSADIGLTAALISGDGAMTTELLEGAGPAAEGVYFSTLALGYGRSDEQIAKFEKNFQARYNKAHDVYAAYYYEVTWLVARAIAAAGNDAKAIRDYLYAMNGDNAYRGLTGVTAFDGRGEVDKPFYIYVVQDGAFRLFGRE
uniref:Amino acid/amide ABC transporter substrate-binding protein, HAAT family n=1 Tax=Candidatus Kentrum sp. DK TaxID=2126562 RepID=A0A450S7Y5_9GAMM|nr:MAG: amino acid/amide ABC transporter substrate-binding protein, HAAT family [Candidatus Kentron sp. DK]